MSSPLPLAKLLLPCLRQMPVAVLGARVFMRAGCPRSRGTSLRYQRRQPSRGRA